MKKLAIISLVLLSTSANISVTAKEISEPKQKSNHKISGKLTLEYSTSSNVGLAPSGSIGLGDDEEDEDFLEDIVDDDIFDNEEIEEADAIDEDGDTVDDLIDPSADVSTDSDNRLKSIAKINHAYKFSENGSSLKSALKVSNSSQYDREDLEKQDYAISTGPEFVFGKFKIRPAITYVNLNKNDKDFLSSTIGSLGIGYDISKNLSVSATYVYEDRDIDNPSSPDAKIQSVNFKADYDLTKKDKFVISFKPKFTDSSNFTRDKEDLNYKIGYERKLPFNMKAGLAYGLVDTSMDKLPTERQDDTYVAEIYVSKKLMKNIDAQAAYQNRDRSSNIAGKDASNNAFLFSISYKF
jgi:predicted porin